MVIESSDHMQKTRFKSPQYQEIDKSVLLLKFGHGQFSAISAVPKRLGKYDFLLLLRETLNARGDS